MVGKMVSFKRQVMVPDDFRSEVEVGRNYLSLDMRQETERVVIESVCVAIIANLR